MALMDAPVASQRPEGKIGETVVLVEEFHTELVQRQVSVVITGAADAARPSA